MSKRIAALLIFATAAIAAFADGRKVFLTVYNDNQAVVREQREVVVGDDRKLTIADVAEQMDPTSVKLTLTSGSVVEQNFEYDLVSQERLLQRRLGQMVDIVMQEGGVVSGRLLTASSWGMVIEGEREMRLLQSGVRQILIPGNAQGLYLRPTLVWLLDGAAKGKQTAELAYVTQGIGWHAEYIAVLQSSGEHLDWQGWVDVNNQSGAAYPEATLKLVAGEIHRAAPEFKERQRGMGMAGVTAMDAERQFEERPMFEYHLYELQRPTTLADRQSKQISLLSASGVPYKQEFHYAITTGNKKVEVRIQFRTNKTSGLYQPLPAGRVRLFQAEASGNREMIGEDRVEHTPVDSDVKLTVGNAFDVTGETVQTDQRRLSDRITETDFKVTVRNRKDKTVTVLAMQRCWGAGCRILNASVNPEKKSAGEYVFTLTVPAGGETELTFTLRQEY